MGLLSDIDIFSFQVLLNVGGKSSHSSLLGSLCSLAVLGFIISITYSSSLDLF